MNIQRVKILPEYSVRREIRVHSVTEIYVKYILRYTYIYITNDRTSQLGPQQYNIVISISIYLIIFIYSY